MPPQQPNPPAVPAILSHPAVMRQEALGRAVQWAGQSPTFIPPAQVIAAADKFARYLFTGEVL